MLHYLIKVTLFQHYYQQKRVVEKLIYKESGWIF